MYCCPWRQWIRGNMWTQTVLSESERLLVWLIDRSTRVSFFLSRLFAFVPRILRFVVAYFCIWFVSVHVSFSTDRHVRGEQWVSTHSQCRGTHSSWSLSKFSDDLLVVGWSVSLFYLYGKTSRCTSLSTLFQAVLLSLHSSKIESSEGTLAHSRQV